MRQIKKINFKNGTHYFFYYMINIKNFNSNQIRIGKKKSYKNIIIYYFGYITIKNISYVKINSVNHLYLIIGKVDEYIEESNGNKHLMLVSTDKNKDTLNKYIKLWDKIKNLIKTINGKPGDYDEKYMKIKFNLDNNLTLNKILRLYNLTTDFFSQEDKKYYPQIFLDED